MNIKEITLKYTKLSSLALGALAVLALPPYYIFPILFLSFGGLFYLVNKAETKKRSFALGYWFGFGFFSFGLSWIGNALLIDAETLGWLYPIVFIACGGFFGLFFAFPVFFCRFFKTMPTQILAFAGIFVIFEWIRSFIFTGFPWNMLGSTLAFSPFAIQLASVIGTYGLSLLVILICSWPVIYFTNKRKKNLILPILLIVIITVFGFARLTWFKDKTESDITLRLVQPSIPQSMKWEEDAAEKNFNEYIELSTKPGFENVDLVIWGETATPFLLDRNEKKMEQIKQAIPENGYLITGVVRFEEDKDGHNRPLNSMFILDKEGVIDFYDKAHLVPFGEYIPFRSFLPETIKPITKIISDFKAGDGHKNIYLDERIPSLGALICYEIIFPSEVLDNDDKPKWLLNLTNDGWYGDSSGPRQHLVSTQLRAVEEGITIVRVANSGISAIISPVGEILGQIPLNQKAAFDTKLPEKIETNTLYGEFGNLLSLVLSLAMILLAFALQTHWKKGETI